MKTDSSADAVRCERLGTGESGRAATWKTGEVERKSSTASKSEPCAELAFFPSCTSNEVASHV